MKLLDIKTERGETEFWETHSIADYWGDLKESDDTFKRPTLTPVTIRFDPLAHKKIKMLAKKRAFLQRIYTIFACKECRIRAGQQAITVGPETHPGPYPPSQFRLILKGRSWPPQSPPCHNIAILSDKV